MDPTAAVLISVVTALGAVIASWLTVRAGKKRAESDVTRTITEVALSLVRPLKDEVDALRAGIAILEREVDALKSENALLHRWAQLLFTQVLEAGYDPYTFDQVKSWERPKGNNPD